MSLESDVPVPDAELARPAYSLAQLCGYFLKLGALGFGGPVALVGYMHRELVERRRWISESDYKEGLALAQLAPGPLAAQLAIYLGYVHYRILGATLVSVVFVLPSFVMVVALGWAYLEYGGLSWMQAVFYGIGPAVIGIITASAYKLTRKTIASDWLLWIVYLASAVCTAVTESEFIALFIGAGLIVWAVKTRPHWRSPPVVMAALPLGVAGLEPELLNKLVTIFVYFAKAGAFVFGSGLAIVPFLRAGVVSEFGWMTDEQFLDAVAVAMITPGPVVITVGFIGYCVAGRAGGTIDHFAGLMGASVAAFATFLPCYLFTIIPAPYFKKYGRRPGIVAFVDGVTAAAIGAIAGAVVVLASRTLIVDTPGAASLIQRLDLPKVAIFAGSLALLVAVKKIPEPLIVVAAGLIGLAIHH